VLALVLLLAGCDWTSYMNGVSSGFNLGETTITPANAAKLHLSWTATSGGPVFAQPVVANGLVYWGSFDGYERATDTSGRLRWKTFIGTTTPPAGTCYPDSLGIVSTATYRDDVTIGASRSVVFVGGGDAHVYALDARTGARLWTRSLGDSPSHFIFDSPAYANGSLYVGVSSYGDCPLVQGQFFRIDARTGRILATLDLTPDGCTGNGSWGSPAIDAPRRVAYFVTGNPGDCDQPEPLGQAMIEVSLVDLHVIGKWVVPDGPQQVPDGDFGSTPNLFTTVVNHKLREMVGAVNKNGIYYAFDRTNVTAGPVWFARIATGGGAPDYGQGTVTPAAYDLVDGMLYAGGDAAVIGNVSCLGSISAIDPATGKFRWRDCLNDGFVIGAVSGAPGWVVVGEGTHLLVVRTSDGHVLFDYTGPAVFQSSATVANGVLYAGDVNGDLLAFTV